MIQRGQFTIYGDGMTVLSQEGREGEAGAAGTGDCDAQGAGRLHSVRIMRVKLGCRLRVCKGETRHIALAAAAAGGGQPVPLKI